MEFGLTQNHIDILISIFNKYLLSGEVIIYGSRVKGNYTPQSDVDLVIKGNDSNNRQNLAEIMEAIEESDLPYLVDIQYFENIKNTELIEHINRVGKVFYPGERK
jgi:predicted nucleotidyltransferase